VDDPFNLSRFVEAQDRGDCYTRVVEELGRGRKATHWMWFVFPQVAGLGLSAMAREYAVASLDEARAYLDHPRLGPRLRECAGIVADTKSRTAEQIFGDIDARKLRSSMSLFLRAAPTEERFQQVLDRYFEGAPDPATERLL
jgi:uncharacterized protein (DUF1810 family)